MRFAHQNRWFRVALILIAITTATLCLTIAPRQQAFAADNELAAVYRNGQLELNIPYDEATARGRVLNIEILDPNDKQVARLSKAVSESRDGGSWKANIPIDRNVAIEDLAWDRLKINAGDGPKVVSLSEILRVPVVRILAQRAYAAGSSASARIITADSRTGNPLAGS